MAFWNEEDKQTTGAHESGGGNMEPIPSGTQVVFAVDEAKNDSYETDDYISLRWTILKGEFKGRKVFQKLRVYDADKSKAAKHKKMFAAIALNAGGDLLKVDHPPTDQELQCLMMKPMAGMLQVWSLTTETGELKEGNWVSQINPIKRTQQQAPHAQQQAPVQQTAPPVQQSAPPMPDIEFDDSDMPF